MADHVWRKTLKDGLKNGILRVYIGHDSREDIAYQVCKQSILDTAKYPNFAVSKMLCLHT